MLLDVVNPPIFFCCDTRVKAENETNVDPPTPTIMKILNVIEYESALEANCSPLYIHTLRDTTPHHTHPHVIPHIPPHREGRSANGVYP